MKTKNRLKLILSFIVLILLFSSCMSTKRTTEKSVTIEKITEKEKDSTSITVTSKKIDDTIITSVGSTGDADCDAKMDAILRQLTTSKSSGDNSYKFYYDEKLRQLRAEFEIGATENTNTNTSQNTNESYSIVTDLKKQIKKVVIPWYLYLVVVYLLRKPIISIIGVFYPPILAIKTAKDLFTAPTKND